MYSYLEKAYNVVYLFMSIAQTWMPYNECMDNSFPVEANKPLLSRERILGLNH